MSRANTDQRMTLDNPAIGASFFASDILDKAGVRDRARQEAVRLLLGAISLTYLCLFAWPGDADHASLLHSFTVPIAAIYLTISLALFSFDALADSISWQRGAANLLNDFTGIALMLQSGGARAAPIILILLWAGSWYAVRFGIRLMGIAILMATATLLLLWHTNPYWHGQPYITATLIVMGGGVPAYAFHLMAATLTANRRLTEHTANRARLLARASHDLRHPLHALGIFNARLASTDLTRQQHELVEHIDMALRNSTEMLQSYLDLASIESNQTRPNLKVFAIQSLFDELSDQGRAAADRAGVHFCFMRTSRHVCADSTLLKAMLQNLIANVIRHAPGSRAVVGCRLDGRNLVLQVYDDGGQAVREPMDASPVNHGLGLTIVRDLARAQNLKVWINDRIGKGFDVRIVGLVPAAPRKVQPTHKGVPEFQPLRGTRVLLVESNQTLRDEMTALLHHWGCNVAPQADMPLDGSGCDVAIVNARATMRLTSRSIERLGVPTILLGDAPARKQQVRQGGAKVIQAARPVTPAQLRSMLMSVR